MRRLIIAAAIPALLCGCTQDESLSIGLNYAATDLGYRNSGALNPGKLFIWDIVNNELIDLRSTIGLQAHSTTRPANLEAKNVKGFEINGGVNLPSTATASVETAVSRSVSFIAKDAVREDNAQIYSSISESYAALGDSGYRAWRIDELRKRQAYKLVVLLDPTYAREEQVAINGSVSASGNLTVNSVGGNISVKVPRESNASCSAAGDIRATCFINVAVLDVFVNDNGNLDYQPARGVDRSKLPEAFRNL